jgi:hypothetical protein
VPPARTTIGHVRRSTDPGSGALRTRRSRLSEIHEDYHDEDEPSRSGNNLSNRQVAIGRGVSSPRTRVSYASAGEPTEPHSFEHMGESSGRGGGESVDHGTVDQHDDDDRSFAPQVQTRTTTGHVRGSTEPGSRVLRTRRSHPSEVRDGRSEPSQGGMSNGQVDARQARVWYAGEPSSSQSPERLRESSRRLGGISERGSDKPPPSYRTVPSNSRRTYVST